MGGQDVTPYKLTDGDEMHAKHPGSFEVPSMKDKLRLVVGQHAKLGFTFDDGVGGERIWYEITAIHGQGETRTYSGKLANDKLDDRIPDTISFENRHIIQVLADEIPD